MKVAIHQPNFLPWIGYFYKMANADRFVFLDNVQFSKGSYTNRVLIKTNNGDSMWLTVPIDRASGKIIDQVKVNSETDWRKKHLATLRQHYGKAKFFDTYFPQIEEVYQKNHEYLSEFNSDLIVLLHKILSLNSELYFSSKMETDGRSTDLLVDICKKLEATEYLSGRGGVKYQDEDLFLTQNIKLEYTSFQHPTYNQLWNGFIPNLSAIDLLFNEGVRAGDIVMKSTKTDH
ncbi:WbqC family protein [candidate division KSB1 bacterium]|nr:WbqC family protein [candidate division KSB1 bacterium]